MYGIEVRYISGHNPDLVVHKRKASEERIDLKGRTYDELHALVRSLGFAPREGYEPGGDRHADCGSWARRGECQKNPQYMLEFCMASCAKQEL